MTPSPSLKPKESDFQPRKFTDLLRHGRFTFTERELMEHLRMTYRTIKQREADPSTLSIAELFRVADLIDKPVEYVIDVVLSEVRGLR